MTDPETCIIRSDASQGTVLGRASTYGAVVRILSEPFQALVEIELTLDDAGLWVGFTRSMFDDLTSTSQTLMVTKLVELIERQNRGEGEGLWAPLPPRPDEEV